jgi:hypothetical protein
MSKLLSDMRGLMQPVEMKVTKGEVVEIKTTSLIVRTMQGLKECTAVNVAQFKIGDRVRVSGDLVVSKIASASSLPTYSV